MFVETLLHFVVVTDSFAKLKLIHLNFFITSKDTRNKRRDKL